MPSSPVGFLRTASRRGTMGRLALASGLLVALALGGCVAYGPGYVAPATGAVVVAPVAPPAPYAETIIASPGPGYFWIGGYWSWVGGRHVWTGGHWAPNRPGYRWVPRHWEQGPGGWHQRGGHWDR